VAAGAVESQSVIWKKTVKTADAKLIALRSFRATIFRDRSKAEWPAGHKGQTWVQFGSDSLRIWYKTNVQDAEPAQANQSHSVG